MFISSIQAAAEYIYLPIHQRITQINQTADWKEKTMLAGLIISVSCAVIAFFAQATLVCGVFSLLSGICGLGKVSIRSYENLKNMKEQIKELEENIHTLQEENQRFQANNQTLESLVSQEKDSVTLLTFENEKLQSEVTKLTVHTDCLTSTSQELIHSVEDLRVHLVVLGPSVQGSQEVEKKLRVFSITMEKQQAMAKNLMEFISKTSVEHSDHLENQKEIIKQLQSLQNNDTTLQKIKELGHLRQQISCSHDKLANILTKTAEISAHLSTLPERLSALQEQCSAENTRLQELREQYSIENTRLQATRQEFSEVSSALQSVLAESRSLLVEKRDDTAALAFQISRLQNLHVELGLHHSDRTNGLV